MSPDSVEFVTSRELAADDRPRTVVLRLVGDVDFFTEDVFRHQAEALLSDDLLDELVVDMSEVGVVDSSGLGLLLDLLRLCRELDMRMVLHAVPSRVRSLLDLTGLSEVLIADNGTD